MILDEELVEMLRDLDIIEELLETAKVLFPKRLFDARAALEAHDREGLERIGHAGKGSALQLGAIELGAGFKRLEELAPTADDATIAAALEEIERTWGVAWEALSA